jgi:branched-chain amino acid transport system ATP-binding protein
MGIIGKRTGAIRFENQDITQASSGQDRAHGRGVLSGGRNIFANLDVRKIAAAADRAPGGLTLDQIFG